MWVVKLGGSLAGGRALRDWLDTLAAAGGGRAVVVPGGGCFADAVRGAHRRWALPDATAHRMALLAMAQYGLMMTGVRPEMSPCATPEAVRTGLGRGAVPVWIPRWDGPECGPDVEASWRVTSDTLAVWFARRLGAEGVILVKSVPVPETAGSAEALAAAGVVDEALPAYVAHGAPGVFVAGPGQHRALSAALTGTGPCGTRLHADGPPRERGCGVEPAEAAAWEVSDVGQA